MTTADEFEAEYGSPVFQSTFQAFAEGLDGNGILDSGDLAVSAGATSNGLDVAATTRGLWYAGTLYTYAGGSDVLTLSANASGSDRWDLVYYDTGTDAPAVREGTPATKPDLPLLQAGEFPLAAVYVADGQTDVTDAEIRNYRVHGQASEEVYVEDAAGEYAGDDVEAVLTEVLRQAGNDPLNGPLDLSGFSGSAPFDLGTNPGVFGPIVDATVDASSPAGTEHSYTLDAGGTTVLEIEVESDGSGGIQNPEVRVPVEFTADLGVIDTSEIKDDAVTAAKIGADAVTDEQIIDSIDLETFRARDNAITGPIVPASHLADLGLNPGVFGPIVDATVDGTPAAGAEQSYYLGIDGIDILGVSAEADGSGGIQNAIADPLAPLGVYKSTTPVGVEGALMYDSTEETPKYEDSGGTLQRPLSRLDIEKVNFDESGSVNAANSGPLWTRRLADGETFEVSRAYFVQPDGTAIPSGVDLSIITTDGTGTATFETTVIAGDGSTIYDDETGTPYASYTNSSGGAENIMVIVDNGDVNSTGTGSTEDFIAGCMGEVV